MQAPVLLIGGGRDATWASGAMTAAMAETFKAAGRAGQAKALVFPDGGHAICGTGAALERTKGEPLAQERARANRRAFKATLDFLEHTLSKRKGQARN